MFQVQFAAGAGFAQDDYSKMVMRNKFGAFKINAILNYLPFYGLNTIGPIPSNDSGDASVRFGVYGLQFDSTNPESLPTILQEITLPLNYEKYMDLDFCQLSSEEFVFWSANRGEVFTKKVSKSGGEFDGVYIMDEDDTFHYDIHEFGMKKLYSVICVPTTKLFIVKGFSGDDIALDDSTKVSYLVLRGGEFNRNDRRIPTVFDNLNFDKKNFANNQKVIPYQLLNEKLLVSNLIEGSTNQFFYHDLAGPTIYYKYNGTENATD